jgi:hypothetical protein
LEYVVGSLVIACIFGAVTKNMYENKGYEGGFWTGFFLGIIGVIIAASKSDMNMQKAYESNTYNRTQGWTCRSCGSNNEQYSTNCHQCNTSRYPGALTTAAITAENRKEIKTWQCASCGTSNDMSSKFCPQCGSGYVSKWKCRQCASINKENSKFCSQCGTAKGDSKDIDIAERALLNERTGLLQASQKLGAAGEAATIYAIDRTQEMITCPACNAKQRSNRDICFHCRARFVDL